VITKEIDGKKCEPFEEALLEVPEEHMGPAMDLLGARKGSMLDMAPSTGVGSTQRIKYRIPTRGMHPTPLAPLQSPGTSTFRGETPQQKRFTEENCSCAN